MGRPSHSERSRASVDLVVSGALRGLLLAVVAPSALVIGAERAFAQDQRPATPAAATQFFVASLDGLVAVAPNAVPLLQRRVTVALDGLRLGAALQRLADDARIALVYSEDVLPAQRKSKLYAKAGTTLAGALAQLLVDLPVDVVVAGPSQVALRSRSHASAVASAHAGELHGVVSDSARGEPVRGAEVSVAESGLRAVTGDDGTFHLPGLPAGRRSVTVRRVGFRPERRVVVIPAGDSVGLRVALTPAVQMLDELIVAGSFVESRRREAPTPVAVLSEAQIHTPSRNRIDQLFRGDVPGVVGYDLGPFSFGTIALVRGRATLDFFNLLKVYVDGIEMPAIDLTSTLSLESIERAELLRGPQGSSVYGSNASGGVLLLFTKKGERSGPHLSGQLAAGPISSHWSTGTPIATESRLRLSGGTAAFTYALGIGYDSEGETVPEASSEQITGNAHTTMSQGPLTISTTAAVSRRRLGSALAPAFTALGTPDYTFPLNTDYILGNQLLGTTVSYARSSRWQVSATLGWDHIGFDMDMHAPRGRTPSDTLRNAYTESHEQIGLRVVSSSSFELKPGLTSTLTGGIDLSRRTTGFYWVQGIDDPSVGGNPDSAYVSASQVTDNRGYFLQNVLGIHDRLFLTAAIRFENNSNVGRQAGLITAPRAGIAYSWTFGDVAIKPRASFGTSLRPPSPNQTAGTINQWYRQLPNPRLRPELQRGLDAGVDIEVGHGAVAFEATYFHQHANDLINIVVIDTAGMPTYQYQNLGKVRNSGVELGFAAEYGALAFRGSYTYTRNRVVRLADDYLGTLEPGDELLYVAREAGGGTVSWRVPARTRGIRRRDAVVEVGVTYIGTRTGADDLAAFTCAVVDEGCRDERDYWMTHPGFAKLRASVSYPLAARLVAFTNVDNLTNRQAFELFNYYPSRGRTILAGIRFGQ